MQSIRDIIDTELQLGFSYFYGADEGYLRRLLRTSPSLEQIYSSLRDDIGFLGEVDEGYFKTPTQLKNFKKLKKYLIEAKKYISGLIEKKKKGSKREQREISKEIRLLDKDLREGLIDKEEYDYAVKMLLRPSSANLDEVKSKFESIDQEVKQELETMGYDDEPISLEDIDQEAEDFDSLQTSMRKAEPGARPFSLDARGKKVYSNPTNQYESVNIDKLVDDKLRRYSTQEFNYLYEDMMAQKQVNPQQAAANKLKKDLALKNATDPNQKKRRNSMQPLQAEKAKTAEIAKLKAAGWTDLEIANLVKGDALT